MYKAAMKEEEGWKKGKTRDRNTVDNINSINDSDLPRPTGTSRSYTLDRLKRESPELFEKVEMH